MQKCIRRALKKERKIVTFVGKKNARGMFHFTLFTKKTKLFFFLLLAVYGMLPFLLGSEPTFLNKTGSIMILMLYNITTDVHI